MELYGNSVQPVAVDMHNLCCPGAQHDFASLSSSGIGPPPFVAGAPFAKGCTSYKWGPFAAPCSQPVEISHAEPMPMSLHASPVAQQIECANPRQGFHLPHPVSETTTGGTCGPAVLLDPQPRTLCSPFYSSSLLKFTATLLSRQLQPVPQVQMKWQPAEAPKQWQPAEAAKWMPPEHFADSELAIRPALVSISDGPTLAAYVEPNTRQCLWEWSRVADAVKMRNPKCHRFLHENRDHHTSELIAAELSANQIQYHGWESKTKGDHAVGAGALLLLLTLRNQSQCHQTDGELGAAFCGSIGGSRRLPRCLLWK